MSSTWGRKPKISNGYSWAELFRLLADLSESVSVALKLPPCEKNGGLINGGMTGNSAMVIDEIYGYIYSVSMVADVASTRLRDV